METKTFFDRAVAVSFVLTAALLSSCATQTLESPDLNQIYGEAAKKHHEFRNPVIVIPGILGSKLVDSRTGQPVWGVFEGEFLNPEKPANTSLVALPMRSGASLSSLSSPIVANGALDRVKFRLFGVPIESRAYASILETLGAAGYQDQQLAESGAIDYGSEHFTCFQFSYDWRKSNVETAKALEKFIKEKKAYVRRRTMEEYGVDRKNIKFDIVAHSMGGLAARYYVRYGSQELPRNGALPKLNWAGTRDVNQLIMVGTPNSGSVLAFEELVEGKKFAPKWLRLVTGVDIPDYSAAVLGTYPSLYELLPRVRHRAFVNQADSTKVNIYDESLWRENRWGLFREDQQDTLKDILPKVADAGEREEIASDHVRKCLNNAQQFHRAMDRQAKPPRDFRISLVAGDAESTKERLAFDLSDGSYEVTKYAPGDAVVLRSSALADERAGGEYRPQVDSAVKYSNVLFLFENHLNLTKTPEFSDNILFRLLEE